MARRHARLLVRIWDDQDWLALTSSQQVTYLALCSSVDLSWCGVAPLLPQRLARISSDMTESKARANLAALEDTRFLVVDRNTGELCVRSYVRHDGLLDQPNVVKAMVKAYDKVHSTTIRRTIVRELQRAREEDPESKGWAVIAKLTGSPLPAEIENPFRKAS